MVKATSDLVTDRSKLSLVFVVLLSLCVSMRAGAIANFTLWVMRRNTIIILKRLRITATSLLILITNDHGSATVLQEGEVRVNIVSG